jgi:uncharacterized protein (DUF1499 family)
VIPDPGTKRHCETELAACPAQPGGARIDLTIVEAGGVLMKRSAVVVFGMVLALSACAGDRPTNLGVIDGSLAACPDSPNCVSSLASEERHRIEPFATGDDPDAAFVLLAELIRRRPDATVIDSNDTYLRVELRTTFFTDDAEFLLNRERRLIQLRSASRLGYSDLGLNRRRIEEIRGQWQRRE